MNERRIHLDGQEIAYTESAGTGHTVVLVHGNSCSARVWRPLTDGSFGRRFRCLALDLPGHGDSARAREPGLYSMPWFASLLAEFAGATDAEDAVFVGWSMGGHAVLEAAPSLPEAPGLVLFGTPPVNGAAAVAKAFLPNPAARVAFLATVDENMARSFAESFLAPGSAVPTDGFVEDILRTDGAARENLLASAQAGRMGDEIAILAGLKQPLAVLHGERDQLIDLDYLRTLTMPTLWRGAIRTLHGVGHAPHVEAPEAFAEVLTEFLEDLGLNRPGW